MGQQIITKIVSVFFIRKTNYFVTCKYSLKNPRLFFGNKIQSCFNKVTRDNFVNTKYYRLLKKLNNS